MPFRPLTPAERRRRRWRRLIERRTLVRHPVSLTRERAGMVVLALLALGAIWYAIITRDESIRSRAVEFLTEATSAEVNVSQASFKMFGGITLRDVSVAVPYDEELDPSAVEMKSREIFRADTLRLVHDPWSLLFGHLSVERVVAVEPTIILSHNVETGVRNWQLLSGPERESPSSGEVIRPRITLRSAKAIVVSIQKDGRRTAQPEWLDADVRPLPQSETGFSIEVRRFSDPAERTMVVFDPGQRLVTNTPFVDAETIRLQLPKAVQLFLNRISLKGEAKLGRLVYRASAPESRDTELRLRNVNCAFPMSMLRSGVELSDPQSSRPSDDEDVSVVRMEDVEGFLDLHGDLLELQFTGEVNGAECNLAGQLDQVSGPFDQMGLNLTISGKEVPAPEESIRQELIDDVGVPYGLRRFLNDYKPEGVFDIKLSVTRAPGGAAPVQLAGTIEPKGASGRCRWFPYLVRDLQGRVRFADKHVYLEELRGQHGPAVISVSGDVDLTTRPATADVHVLGTSVPLDEDLFEVLAPRYQAIWSRFNPKGSARIDVQLHRSPGDGPILESEGHPAAKWDSRIVADLIDAEMVLEAFPYPLDRVSGKLVIEGGSIRFEGLTGHHGDAVVTLDGHADFLPDGQVGLALTVDARETPLDQTLMDALPPEGRGAIAQFKPSGHMNLTGTVTMTPGDPRVVYDLNAELVDAALHYESFPYALEGVSGSVRVQPEGISVVEVTGRHGAATITANGEVTRQEDGFVADLRFSGKQLELEADLYRALPPPFKRVWDMLSPTGHLRVETLLHYSSRGGEVRHRHRAEIWAEGCAIQFAGFPVRLTNVDAHVEIADDRVTILSMTGEIGEGRVEVAGSLDVSSSGRQGALTVYASNMVLDDNLLGAMPEGLRTVFVPMRPTGTFDLALDPLVFEMDADGKTRWNLNGELQLEEATAKLGVDLQGLDGRMTGFCEVDSEGRVSLESEASLGHATVAGWQLGDLRATIKWNPTTRKLSLEDVSARAYGGEIVGTAEIEMGEDHSEYQASFNVRDVQLRQYLDTHNPRKDKTAENKAEKGKEEGAVFASLVLQGRTGTRAYREGTGEVFIRDAQLWKLPLGMAILQVLNLTPDENVFHDGWIRYFLAQDVVTLQQIDLQGKAVSFIGVGKYDIRSRRLDVTLLGGSPIRIRVPFLTDILEGASREIMEVRVTGTLDHPIITPQPLKSLTNALKALFPEPPSRGNSRSGG